jgi:hypothetical protein
MNDNHDDQNVELDRAIPGGPTQPQLNERERYGRNLTMGDAEIPDGFQPEAVDPGSVGITEEPAFEGEDEELKG